MPPIDHELNLITQSILTYASWALTAVILVVAIRMGRREGTPFYALMVLAVMVGAFIEPIYDVTMMLYFYSTEGMWTHFTAFDIPQPVWTHSGYVVLYASAAIFVAREIHRGTLTRRKLFAFAGLELLMSCAFEMFGINAGAYSYWGPHVLRIFHYPLAIGVLEAAQVMCFAVAAALLRARAREVWQLLGLFVLFPCTFLMANLGAGWPMVIALHTTGTSTAFIAGATILSLALAVLLVWTSSTFLPDASGDDLDYDADAVSLAGHAARR